MGFLVGRESTGWVLAGEKGKVAVSCVLCIPCGTISLSKFQSLSLKFPLSHPAGSLLSVYEMFPCPLFFWIHLPFSHLFPHEMIWLLSCQVCMERLCCQCLCNLSCLSKWESALEDSLSALGSSVVSRLDTPGGGCWAGKQPGKAAEDAVLRLTLLNASHPCGHQECFREWPQNQSENVFQRCFLSIMEKTSGERQGEADSGSWARFWQEERIIWERQAGTNLLWITIYWQIP